MVTEEEVLQDPRSRNGTYEIVSKVPLQTMNDLTKYYTPGVAYLSEEIKRDKSKAYEHTTKANSIAIVNDGTRILGLGDIGPEAGLPVMEGKAILFKKFGGVNAIPLCIDTKDEEEIIKFVTWIAPTFGAVNIEDISTPKVFEIVERLSSTLDIPIFHDDNHGTGVIVYAALANALKLVGKKKDARILVYGAGSAGFGVATQLAFSGFKNIVSFDTAGSIYSGREENMNKYKSRLAEITNPKRENGTLDELVKGADVLIGFSSNGKFTRDMIGKMNEKPIVFALTNPVPEISYDEAKKAGAYIVATGRSDTPNQVNNLLAFPGIMRGLLDSRAKHVHPKILEAAALAIARCVGGKLSKDYIIPSAVDQKVIAKVAPSVAEAVAMEAQALGLSRVQLKKNEVRDRAKALIKRYAKIERKIVGK